MAWSSGPLPWRRGSRIDKELIKAVTFKGFGKKRRMAFALYSVGVRGAEKGQSRTIFRLMPSAWTAQMTARVIAGYLDDVAVETIQQK